MSTVLDAADSAAERARDSAVHLSTDVDRGLFGGVRRVVHSHALETDALLAMVLLALSTLWLVTSLFSGVRIALVQVALIVPLVWRRTNPTAVFVVVSTVALMQWLLDYRLVGDIALLVALYTVAVHESRLRTLLATAVLEVGAVLAATRWFPAGTVPRSIVFLTATVVAALFAGLTVRSGSEYMDWLAERAARLEVERDQQSAIGAALERGRIAREMHDIVAHSLSVVITLADAATLSITSDPAQAADAMHHASAVGRQALGDMRTMIGVLRTEDLGVELGPQPDVGQLGDLFERVRATGLAVTMDVVGEPFALGAATELTVYRILQEALTNTIKHASATTVHVVLRYAHPLIELSVVDDGHGAASPGPGGHGIEGMCERAGLHGGSLSAGPSPGHGWVVSATLRPDSAPVKA
jgi:signal transduction histidine kinase